MIAMEIYFLAGIFTVCAPGLASGLSTTYGKDFYLGFLENPGSNNYLLISSEKSTKVTIQSLTGEPREVIVIADQVTRVELQDRMYMYLTQKSKMGLHLQSTEDITVYGMSQSSYSTDGLLFLPVTGLAYEYIISSYTPYTQAPSPSLIGIVATSDRTRVEIHLKTAGFVKYGGYMYRSGNVITVDMERMETFQISHSYDLTGTRVVASRPVAVLSGSMAAKVPASVDSSSHLVEQLPPVVTWGKTFIVVTLASRRGDVLRVVSSEDDTRMTVYGGFNFTGTIETRGAFQEMDTNSWTSSSAQITCDKPCLVAHYAKGKDADDVPSDPFMMLVPPIEQYTNNFAYTPSISSLNNMATIITESKFVDNMFWNNQSLKRNRTQWTSIKGTKYSSTVLRLGDSTGKIWNREKWVKFCVLFYGFSQLDNSYGHPGRYSLEAINQIIPKISIQDFYQESCSFNAGKGNTGEPNSQVATECSGKRLSYEDSILEQDRCVIRVERNWKLRDYCGHTVFSIQNIKIVKSKPIVTFPRNMEITCQDINNMTLTGVPSVDACADNVVTVNKEDKLSRPEVCSSDVGGTVYRHWNISDRCGNVREHVQVLSLFSSTSTQNPAKVSEEAKLQALKDKEEQKKMTIIIVAVVVVVILICLAAIVFFLCRRKSKVNTWWVKTDIEPNEKPNNQHPDMMNPNAVYTSKFKQNGKIP